MKNRPELKENRTRRLPTHAPAAWLHPLICILIRFIRGGNVSLETAPAWLSPARVPNQRADPISGVPAVRKALFCRYISWDG